MCRLEAREAIARHTHALVPSFGMDPVGTRGFASQRLAVCACPCAAGPGRCLLVKHPPVHRHRPMGAGLEQQQRPRECPEPMLGWRRDERGRAAGGISIVKLHGPKGLGWALPVHDSVWQRGGGHGWWWSRCNGALREPVRAHQEQMPAAGKRPGASCWRVAQRSSLVLDPTREGLCREQRLPETASAGPKGSAVIGFWK